MKANQDDRPFREKELAYFSLGIQTLMALAMSLATLFPYRKGFFNTILSGWFFYPFFSVFAISLFMVYIVHWISIRLDQRYRWEEKFLKRLLYQLLFGWIVPVIFSVLYTWAYLHFLGVNMMSTLYSRYKFPFVLALTLILDIAYMCYYLDWYFRMGRAPFRKTDPGQHFADDLTFAHNGGKIKIMVKDIAYLCSHGKHTAIQFHEGDPLILTHVSLDDLLPRLNPGYFLKVNRSYIITRKAYDGYTARSNRGILLLLKPPVKEDVTVSRAIKGMVLTWINDAHNLNER